MAQRPPRPRPVYGPTIDQIVRRIRPKWMRDALCREHPEISWFPELGEDAEPAKQVCRRCAVMPECLAYATATGQQGIWGATSARQRARILADEEQPR